MSEVDGDGNVVVTVTHRYRVASAVDQAWGDAMGGKRLPGEVWAHDPKTAMLMRVFAPRHPLAQKKPVTQLAEVPT